MKAFHQARKRLNIRKEIHIMKLGNESLFTDPAYTLLKQARVGMITNYTGIDTSLERTLDRLIQHDINVTKLFAPEHGFFGVEKAGEWVDNNVDRKTGIEIISLYDHMKHMDPNILNEVDILVFEIQDVGVRFYTYISTLFKVMTTINKTDIPLVILDRPNPIGGTRVEGAGVDRNYRSFVGEYDLPVRHGMTIGELAVLYKHETNLDIDLHVVKMERWKREWLWNDVNLAWIPPSQNIPDLTTSLLYPGTAFIEGTNLSEGRGTTMPFRWIGAPWINGEKWSAELNTLALPGVIFRPVRFKPSLSKHADSVSEGVEVHIVNNDDVMPAKTGLYMINTVMNMYPDQFEWIKTKGELFIDFLWGNSTYRRDLTRGRAVSDILHEWDEYAARFKTRRNPYLLYS